MESQVLFCLLLGGFFIKNFIEKVSIRNKKNASFVAECGVFLALIIIIDYISSVYISKTFPEGIVLNCSFILIMILAYRQSPFWAGLINLIASFISNAILTGAQMFPVVAIYSWWGIVISLLLDYLGASFLAIIISFYLVDFLFKKKQKETKIIILIFFSSIIGFIFTFISGFWVWGNYVNSSKYSYAKYGVYLYSFIYNLIGFLSKVIPSTTIFLTLNKSFKISIKRFNLKELPFVKLIKKNMNKEWLAYTNHNFGQKIANGSLTSKQFNKYMVQDLMYLNSYKKNLMLLAKLSKSNKIRKFANQLAQSIIQEEILMHKKYDIVNKKMSKTTKSYIDYMNKIDFLKNEDYLFFVLISCFIGYAHLGNFIIKINTSDKYLEWIKMYSSKKFFKNTNKITKIAYKKLKKLNKLDYDKCLEIFKKTLILEKEFFDQVF